MHFLPSDGNASFLRAARAGNLEKVLEYLKGSIDINTSNANGLNALHLASKEGHVAVVTELVKRGANVNAATKKGNTAVHIASLAGQEEVAKILVRNGANVNVQSQNGFTPLYMAAQENHDGVVKFLLANGANQSLATEDGFTPLAVALQQGHDKVVAVLLENDAKGRVRLPALHIAAKKDDCKAAALLLQNDHDPDVTSKSGFTPLHIAAHYGNENIGSLLLEKNADVNYAAKHQITPLHVAAKWGKSNMVTLLLDKGAKIDASTRDGLTPLHCAARSGHDQVVDLLLERGAPITAKTKNGLAPLHMASQGDHVDSSRILLYHKAPVDDVTVDYLTALHVAAHCGHVRVAKLLLDRKADPNARALNGFTPLHIACKKNRIKVVELLLKHGASIEATTESGLTPLHVASFMGCMNIVIYLIQHGANPDVPTIRGETPLHLAARANQSDIIRILLRNGAHVDAAAREQQTPLHIAARLGNVDIVGLLLQHGAAVDSTTKDMYTALHIAAKEGQEEVASVLLDHGASLTSTTKKGFTPLHLAAKYGNIKVARLLLQKDAPVDAQGKNGVTPLHVAAHYDHVNVALLLLDKGAFPHATAKNGYTPLHIAAKKNQMDIATTLLEYGAKPSAESKAGFTPIHLASQEGHTDMTTLLIEHHADVSAPAKNGLTPLHLCAQEDRVNVAAILVKNGAAVDPPTKAGYTPLHVACHFGQINMIRFLLQHGADVNAITSHGYTPLHQAAQQGHTLIINLLLEHKASPNTTTNQGQTALSIAQRLGYISVVETLKIVTETVVTTTTTTVTEEKYKVVAPETMQETFMSDSEDEGAEDTMLGDQSFRYLTADEMKSLGDDSLPIDVTRDERGADSMLIAPPTADEEHLTPQHIVHQEMTFTSTVVTDNVDIARAPVHAGKLKWKTFLVSFMVDARGGAMRGCRHSGVRVIIPPRKASMPMRITCRYLRKEKLAHPPPLMEGEACGSRILEVGPAGAKFLGPVIIEVPHFASLRGREREITILRSDNGETWREHIFDASEDAVHDVFNESFEGEDLTALDDLNTNRITRILTTDFPQYFAIITRIRQEVHAIGPEGGMVSSTVVPQVQAVFPDGALTKKIKVGLQAHPITPELVTKLLGNRVAVSPIVTVEPRRRKFHKPITLTIPVPQAATKGMINQYSGDAPTLRLLCSITGGTTKAQWEDVTGSTPLTFVNDCVSFTTTVSARFWLMDCRQVNEATKFATELYREAIHVPFMAKFVVFAKRHDPLEAQLRVFCMTDDKEDKTLECQEHFTEVAKSRDVEVLEGKSQFLEFAGNLIPVTKSGEQLKLTFQAFRENRLPFIIRVKDPHQEPLGRVAFMREPRVGRGEPPQTPICNLNISLPEAQTSPVSELVTLEKKYGFVEETGLAKPELIHRADLRLSDIAKELKGDWVPLALQLDIPESDINAIRSECVDDYSEQSLRMLRLWLQRAGNKATGNSLEKGLRKINREDIVNQCMFNVELVTDDVEKAVAKVHLDQSGFDTFKEELGSSRDASLRRETSLNGTFDERDIMKEAESAAETSSEGSDKDAHFAVEAEAQKAEKESLEDALADQIIITPETRSLTEEAAVVNHHDTAEAVLSDTVSHASSNQRFTQSSGHDEEISDQTSATISSETAAEFEISSGDDKPQTETHMEKKEWTETDESGSVRQVTQITTETSIKLGGEGTCRELQKVKSKTCETADKEKLPETDEEMLSFVEKRNFFQRLSLTSETIPTSSKWTQEVSLDDIPMAEGEIVKEQISFEERFKMFEPDEENMKKKTQKRDRAEQPTVYRYNFTKPNKDPPPVPPHPVVGVVSELEKAEQIVQKVNEELNAAECVENDKETLDSDLTLEKVEQEVSSLLAEVDKEERALAAANCFLVDKVNKPMSLNLQSELKQGSGEDLDDKIHDHCVVSDLNPQTPETLLSMTAKYEEDRITPEDIQHTAENLLFDSNTDLLVQLVEDDHGPVSFSQEQPSATVKSPVNQSSAYSSSLSQQLSNLPEDSGVALVPECNTGDAYFESSKNSTSVRSSEMGEVCDITKQIDNVVRTEETIVCSKVVKSTECTDDDTLKPTITNLDISRKLNDQIKTQIFHEELDQSIEESPLEIKHITEEIKKTFDSGVQIESSVYHHIKTQIFSQELGEDIESGSPEKKVISPTIPEKDIVSMEGKLSSSDLESDSVLICKAEDGLTLATVPQEEEHLAMCIGSGHETASESLQAQKSESFSDEESFSLAEKLTVEHDDCLKEYEEAKAEYSLAEQLQALASHKHYPGQQVLDNVFPGASSDSHSPDTDLGFPDLEVHPRSDYEVSYSRSNQKEMRSLKSTKQVSTIEELSSIESSDSPQELNQQDLMNIDVEMQKEDILRRSLERDVKEVAQTETEKPFFTEGSHENKFPDFPKKIAEESLLEETKIKKRVNEVDSTKHTGFSELTEHASPMETADIVWTDVKADKQDIVQPPFTETSFVEKQDILLDKIETDIIAENIFPVSHHSESSSSDNELSANDKSSVNEDEDSKASTPRVPEAVSKLPSIIPKSCDTKKPKDSKEESDGETKFEDGAPGSSELITPHKKEESFSSSGDTTESPYYSVETSDYIRSPRSTPAASRPCSSEFEINVLSAVGSEYETCATSQDVSGEISGSYATAATSQETSYSTACSSLSHSSRESAYSVDSESSGHLASVEVSSEASETLVPSAQEMEMEFAPDVEMPVLDEEYSFADIKEPYDMDIPESVIRSGIELPFMKGWSIDDISYDKNVKHLTQQWTEQCQSDVLDSFHDAESSGQRSATFNIEKRLVEQVAMEQMSRYVVDYEPPFATVSSAQPTRSEVVHQTEECGEGGDDEYPKSPILSSHEEMYETESKNVKSDAVAMLENGVPDHSSPNIDEEQLSMSESSVTHSEQTWQTSSVDTAFQVSSCPSVCTTAESRTVTTEGAEDFPDRQVNVEHVFDEPPLSPDPQQSSTASSFLQLNGPVEVDFNPEYDIPDDGSTVDANNSNIPAQQIHFNSSIGLSVESEAVESFPVSEEVIHFQVVADASLVNIEDSPYGQILKSPEDVFYSGLCVDAEKPEAQQDQLFRYSDSEEHPGGLGYQDATYLPESEQCDLQNLIGESSDSFINSDQSGEFSSQPAIVESPVIMQSTEFVEKCDGLDTSPEDERYDPSLHEKTYRVLDASHYEEVLESNGDSIYDLSVHPISQESASFSEEAAPDIFDNVSCTDLYTHQEEEEDFEVREPDLVPSPVPSADDDKQSTPSFDTLSGRKFFKIGEHDDSAASSLQEFERLEAEIATGRSSRGSGDSGERPMASKSSEQDDVSMNSLTEFEKLEKECVDGEHANKTVEDGILLSEIDEGHESQASDGQETLSDEGQEHESDDSDDYEKRMSEIDEIIRMAQCNVEQFHEGVVDDLSEGITLEEYSVTQKILTSNGNSTESSVVDQSPSPKKHVTVSMSSKLCDVSLSDNSSKYFADDLPQHETDLQENAECKLDQSSPLLQGPAELHVESVDSTHGEAWLEKKLLENIDESEFISELDVDNGIGPDSSSSGEKNGARGDCMVSSSDSIDPSSSTATHATYQFETDSVMSSSINSAQASGEECTMVSSTDTLEPEAVLTYSQGEIMNEEKADGTLSTFSDRTFVRMSFPETSSVLCELEASTESSHSTIREELPKYDIEEKVKSFLKKSGKTSDDPGDLVTGPKFCDPEKISKDILQALEKLEVSQQSGEVQFEKIGKNGKIVKVTQHVIEESHSIPHAKDYSHEQMEMFLNKLTDEYQGSQDPVIVDYPQGTLPSGEQCDQDIQSEAYSTFSVPKAFHDSAAHDSSSLPSEISLPHQTVALGFSLSEEEKMGGEDVSHTTTTTTRIVTTVTTQDGEQQEQAATEESGDELRHSMEVILNQFMSEDPSSTPKEQPQ